MKKENHILVEVETHYIPEQSNPQHEKYVFSYKITITNQGTNAAKLLNRHWIIKDANGSIEEVMGAGVVGEQPHLQSGQSYHYTSGAILKTSVGTMEGQYEMTTDNGEHFFAPILPFTLSIPRVLH
jgi:ApaG protein